MQILQRILGISVVFLGIFIWLIASFDLVIYGDKTYAFYERQYEKYQVLDDLQMDMPDVMHVTSEMMEYLKGRREELSVITTVDGVSRDFFDEQDRLHMKDVQDLFLQGLQLQRYAFVIFLLCLTAFLYISKRHLANENSLRNRENLKILCKSYWIGLGVFLSSLGALVYLFASDFTKYFIVFHEIFFDNDLWIFDATINLMIRMLPEGFFYDISARIVFVFASGLVVLLFVSVLLYNKKLRHFNKRN